MIHQGLNGFVRKLLTTGAVMENTKNAPSFQPVLDTNSNHLKSLIIENHSQHLKMLL